MLYHYQSVPQIPQVLQSIQQFVIVSLVQADAGLVQNIAYPHQSGTDLGSQTDTLCFTAGQGSRSSGQGQIFQSHIHQKSYSCADLLQHTLTDELLLFRQRHGIQEFLQITDGHGCDLINILVAYGNRQRFLLQSHALTFFTGSDAHEGLIFLFAALGSGLTIAALHIFDQAFKGYWIHTTAALAGIMHQDLFTVGAVDQNVMNLLGIILEGSIQIKIVFLRQCPQNSIGKAGLVRTGLPAHDRDGSLIDAESLVRDHQILVEFHLISQAEAYRAGTERIVEGKASGLHFADTDTTVRTGKALAESRRFAADHIHHQQPLCQFQYVFNRVCQTALNTILYHQTIYHDVDIVLDIFIQFDLFRQFIHAAVDPYPDITASLGALQHLGMLALAASDHGGQQLDLRAFSHVHDLIHHLIYSLLGNLSATLWAVGNTDSRIQQTEIVINLCYRTYGRTRVTVGGFLVNGDSGGQSFDAFHIGLLHLTQELSRIGGQGFHVASLSLCIDRVECQRGLTGTGHTGQYHQLVSGNVHINVFQVMFIGTPDLNVLPGTHLLCFFHCLAFLK